MIGETYRKMVVSIDRHARDGMVRTRSSMASIADDANTLMMIIMINRREYTAAT